MTRNESGGNKSLHCRVFFLDVKSQVLRQRLTECITRLGGVIGQYLDTKVKYVVTDRPEKDWPTQAQIHMAKASLNSPPNNISPNQADSPPAIDVDLMPRGKMLALRATECSSSLPNTPQSSKVIPNDVLAMAAIRKLTILVAVKVLAYCEQHLKAKSAVNSDTSRTSKLRQLKGPYIKHEDNKKLFKPNFGEFSEWPDIHLDYDPFICPFGSPAQSPSVRARRVLMMPENPGTPDSIIVGNKLFINPNSNRISTGLVTPVNTGTPLTFNTAKNLEKFGIITPKLSQNTVEKKDLKQVRKRKSDIPYCDICSDFYKNLDEHLMTPKHQDQVANKENYKHLIRVIRSLPPWTDITEEAPATENTSEGEEEYSGPHYPSLTPPSHSSTTIRLTRGSARIFAKNSSAKGTFLPLHDIAAMNNKDCNSFKISPTTAQLLNISIGKVDEREEVIEASCITPPLIPPHLLQELDIIEDEPHCDGNQPQELSLEL